MSFFFGLGFVRFIAVKFFHERAEVKCESDSAKLVNIFNKDRGLSLENSIIWMLRLPKLPAIY